MCLQEEPLQKLAEQGVKSSVESSPTPAPGEPSQPLEQRVRRKERRNPEPAASPGCASSLPDPEQEDLEFLESLTRPEEQKSSDERSHASQQGGNAAAPTPPVVFPVQLVGEKDKKELEDWLDDFLAD